jgi:hypothetical protein
MDFGMNGITRGRDHKNSRATDKLTLISTSFQNTKWPSTTKQKLEHGFKIIFQQCTLFPAA